MKKYTKDIYGRYWNLSNSELCPICKQPDNCGDCNHKKMNDKEVLALKLFFNKKSKPVDK
jgi:hypothetical protein